MDTDPICSSVEPTTSSGRISVSGNGQILLLCEVCNLQLTSAAQVQLHYKGRSHQRRVTQLKAGGVSHQASGSMGSPVESALQKVMCNMGGPSLKLLLPYPEERTSPSGPFPNLNLMDPIQKAIINHTFGVTLVPKERQVISCCVCQLKFNSDAQADAHYQGSRHAKKLKSQGNKITLSILKESKGSSSNDSGPPLAVSELKSILPPSSSPPLSSFPPVSSSEEESEPLSKPSVLPTLISPSTFSPSPAHSVTPAPDREDSPPAESEEEKAKKLLYCSLCKVAVNSLSQLEAHNAGTKHKTMMNARSGAGPIKSYPRAGTKQENTSSAIVKGSGLQNKTFHCQICDVHVNSEVQLKQHISSRRHKDRVAGKPSKPKYSPYHKPQRSIPSDMVSPSLACTLHSPVPPPSPLQAPTTHLQPTISLHPFSCSAFQVFAPGRITAGPGSILYP